MFCIYLLLKLNSLKSELWILVISFTEPLLQDYYKCITSQIFAHFYEKHHHILHNKDSLGMQPFQPVLTFHMQVYMHIFAPQKTWIVLVHFAEKYFYTGLRWTICYNDEEKEKDKGWWKLWCTECFHDWCSFDYV